MPPQKEADGRLYNLKKLEPTREDSRASLRRIVPVKNTGRWLNPNGRTARDAVGDEILSGDFRPHKQRKNMVMEESPQDSCVRSFEMKIFPSWYSVNDISNAHTSFMLNSYNKSRCW